jgi:exopolysaccharide production protein ExoZ
MASMSGAASSQSSQPAILIQVQVLRALAAGCIALHHAQWDAETLQSRSGHSFQAWNPIPWSAGVDIFFVISGLIMVHTSQRLFAKPGGARLFLTRRIARIVPLYWATITLYVGMELLASSHLNQTYIAPWFVTASYLFIPAARPDSIVQPVYELGWTLNYEMLFYLLFAVAIMLPLRWASAALLATLAALVIVGQIAAPLPEPFAFWTNPIVIEFAFGAMIGLMCVSGIRLRGLVRAGLVVTGLAALLFAATFPKATWELRPLVYGLPAALIVGAAALATSRSGRDGAFTRWAAAAGDASFALYLLHPFVIRLMRGVFWKTGLAIHFGPLLFVVMALAASFGVALISYRWFEKPLTHYTRCLLGAGGDGIPPMRPAGPAASVTDLEAEPALLKCATQAKSDQ